MFHFLDSLRGVDTFWALLFKVFVAMVCGGVVGIEREHKRRPAGFRTHILVSLGASMTVMTSEFLLAQGFFTDPGRLGAQVIAGIGFLGAGTIIVTKNRQVKGLTTAAGLWASAIAGLAVGAGYFEAALLAVLLIMLAELCFSRVEYFIMSKSKLLNVFVEYTESQTLGELTRYVTETGTTIVDMEITKSAKAGVHNPCVIFSLQIPKKSEGPQMLGELSALPGVVSVEEL